VLNSKIEQFLGARGFKHSGGTGAGADTTTRDAVGSADPAGTPLDFVCEEDVRTAIRTGRKLLVSERAIVTPSARELGEAHRVFTVSPWRG
jgi:hypothetical protein